MKKLINIIAILAIIFSIISLVPLKIDLKFNSLSTPISIILAALAIISFDTVLHFKWLKNPQYFHNYRQFVDRYNLVNETVNLVSKKNIIVNVFGENGIGVTNSLQFIADLINKKTNLFLRIKYCGLINGLFKINRKARYFNISRVKSIDDICKLVFDSITSDNDLKYSIPNLSVILNKRKKRYILIFDEIKFKEQMRTIEEFCLQLSQYSPKTSYIIGTHSKSLSYQIKYNYLEVLKFNTNELTILAKVHNVKLKENESIELFELSNGVPMFAYLLIRYYDADRGLQKTDLINYLSEKIIPSLDDDEMDLLQSICILSITQPRLDLREINDFLNTESQRKIPTLEKKGLINIVGNNYIVVNRLVLDQLNNSIPISSPKCNILYQKYKNSKDEDRAILYLLLSKCKIYETDTIAEYMDRKLSENDTIALSFLIEPLLKYKIDIKNIYPTLYIKYVYVCVYTLNIEGNYVEAKKFLDDLIIDGKLLKRIDNIENEIDYKFYFLWADTEHLLNNYETAIDIIENLILKSQNTNPKRLPQLLWMKAHCLRHQWSLPEVSKEYYQKCLNESIKQQSNEYIIRSIHGLICISFIQSNSKFNYKKAFSYLKDIYRTEPHKWDQYKYMTLKYEALYFCMCKKYNIAEKYLNNALNGFLRIKKRNIYDVYFEFGELYRMQGNFKNSIKFYMKSIEFSKINTDYNLQSLSEIGKIISEYYYAEDYSLNFEETLLNISKKAKVMNLNLNHQYARYIAQNLTKENLSTFKLFNP